MKLDKTITKDILASFVVFLVALPLCMGIAVASGLSPEKGLITGIIGGLVVGLLAGSPLQVSGPAAGLVVLVWEIFNKFGLQGLALITLLAGGLQILAGVLRFGQIFRAVSPSVIYGMLSGIGILIFSSQFHLMIDEQPLAKGYQNLLAIPNSLFKIINFKNLDAHIFAAIIGISTISAILIWDKFKPNTLRLLPGALFGIVLASILSASFDFSIKHIEAPKNLLNNLSLLAINPELINNILSWTGITMIFSMFLIASAETLLSASAVDKMHNGPRTNHNRELLAQGVGNMLCGLLQALPMTGVIVRSSANVNAGAKTRLSATLHGAWLLGFIVLLPDLLAFVPSASLAALLVLIGYKLINFSLIKTIYKKGTDELIIFLMTVSFIVLFDLLTGIIIGFLGTIVQLVYKLTHLQVSISKNSENEYLIEFSGAATFLRLPTLSDALESIPKNSHVCLKLTKLNYIDHACLEQIFSWEHQYQQAGGYVRLENEMLNPIIKESTQLSIDGNQMEVEFLSKSEDRQVSSQ